MSDTPTTGSHGNAKFPPPTMRAAYDGSEEYFSDATGFAAPADEPTLTQQNSRDDNNPNVVMEQFTRTGDMTLLEKSNPQYGDFIGVSDYQESLNIVIAAQTAFMELPATLRKRFNNDPAEYVDFVSDPENVDEMRKLGMLRPNEELSPPSVRAPHSEREEGGGNSAGKNKTPPKGSKKGASVESDAEGDD